MRFSFIIIITNICFSILTFGSSSPKKIVFAKWGKHDGQVGLYKYAPHYGIAPDIFKVHRNGDIYISDRNNRRIVVFDQNGNFKKNLYPFGNSRMGKRIILLEIDNNGDVYCVESISAQKYNYKKISFSSGKVEFSVPIPVKKDEYFKDIVFIKKYIFISSRLRSFVFTKKGFLIKRKLIIKLEKKKFKKQKVKFINMRRFRNGMVDPNGNIVYKTLTVHRKRLKLLNRKRFNKNKLKKIFPTGKDDSNYKGLTPGSRFLGVDMYSNTYWRGGLNIFVFSKNGFLVKKVSIKNNIISSRILDLDCGVENIAAVDIYGNIYRSFYTKEAFIIIKFLR